MIEGSRSPATTAADGWLAPSEATTTCQLSVQRGLEAMARLMVDVAAMAFNADEVMIEAQSRHIHADSSRRPDPKTADKVITLFTRLLRTQDKDPVQRATETKRYR